MDKLNKYRSILKKLLSEYYELSNAEITESKGSEASDRLAFDEERDQYLWFRFGWDNKKQIQHIIVYFCIKNDKIWVEEDSTNLGVVDDLLSAGIPQSDIVLGFHHPSKRGFTEFATA
ncbi:XisI protein [Aetokthonos hydrillicola Thurmond2011]|uniref:XisI protein n=1 Tax=Aetokthonos hydrillicola Thurmond2011 TaxID=2712845 RepID=A0AAP5I3Z3_9CYAN|nr:XisI protein [Aetokthonos hydrillicola]MBO3462781.1 XisI protein [Aetokthonos hydrillicola CCALA 1050]MBW4590177.1 XisI protein [Aetokthonos hydrillicola CCALA 1050]MDR9893322.1 XisI protein [Aetokthonos hydrillicola Thurmond2011]